MTRPKAIVPYPNTFWVRPGQFLAGEHPGDLSDDILMTRLSALLDAGVRTVLDLTEERETEPYYYSLRDLAEERRVEVSYFRIPIPDRGIPSLGTLRRILDIIDRSLADDNAVFVHCFGGIGRTGTVVGCYLKRHGLAAQSDVIGKIAELRSFMPIGREPSPHTPHQVQMVENWKQGV